MTSEMDFPSYRNKVFQLYAAKDYDETLKFIEAHQSSFPEQAAQVTFWHICLLSLCGQADKALSVLENGLEAGLWWHENQFHDNDLDSIRELPRFKELVTRSHERWEAEGLKGGPDRTVLVPSGPGPYPLLIALHGYSGNKDSDLSYWQIACDKGWLVFLPQSQIPLYPNAYFWETPESSIQTILFHLNQVRQIYRIDVDRILVAGISQGGGLAALAGLAPELQAAGSLSLATWWESAAPFESAVQSGKSTRAYFISGLKDQSLERGREIQTVLKKHQIPVQEEAHPDLGHEFPPDFEKSFDNAINFIFS